MLNEPAGPATAGARASGAIFFVGLLNTMLTGSPGMKAPGPPLTLSPGFTLSGGNARLAGFAPILICALALSLLVLPVATTLTVPCGVLAGMVALLSVKLPDWLTWAVPSWALLESATKSTMTVSPGWKWAPFTSIASPG